MQARYYDPIAGRFLGTDPVHVDLNSGGNFNRYWYANNNPYRFVDPDGRCPANTGTRICIHAKSFDKSRSTGANMAGTSDLDAAAKDGAGNVRVRPDARNPPKKEKLGSINRQSDGSLRVERIADTKTGRTNTAETAVGTPPSNAEAVIHGHIDDRLTDDVGQGDSDSLISRSIPNYAVDNKGRIIVHEVVDGRYQVRMISGSMTEAEEKHFMKVVEERQVDFY